MARLWFRTVRLWRGMFTCSTMAYNCSIVVPLYQIALFTKDEMGMPFRLATLIRLADQNVLECVEQ